MAGLKNTLGQQKVKPLGFLRLLQGALLGLCLAIAGLGLCPQVSWAQTSAALDAAQEDLTLEIPPTTIIFDFYLADQYRGEVLMTYTDQWAKFHDPEGVLELLPEVRDRQAVVDLINHGEILEFSRVLENVGTVQVNPSNFQAQLVLEPAVLDAKKLQTVQENVEPSRRLKLLNNFSVVASNQLEGEGFDSTLSHRNALSFGRNRIEFDGNYADGMGYELRGLLAAHEKDETLFRAGLTETRGLTFARGQPVLGVSVGSNIDTLFDDESIKSEEVTVFVPSRSRVQVFRNERLVYTDILDFGLQQLDTSSFPTGSYEIRVEITEQVSGRVTSQTQFFTKTNRLVPFGRPEWLVQLGFARDELNPNTSEPIWQALYRARVGGSFELGGALLGGADLNIFEPQARVFWRGLELRGNASFTDAGDVAVSGFAQLLTEKYGTLTAQMRRTIAGHNTTPSTNADIFNPLSQEIDLISGRWTHTFGRVQLTLQGVRSVQGSRTSLSWGPSIRYPIFVSPGHRLELQGDYVAIRDSADTYGALLTYQYTPQPAPWLVNTRTSHRETGLGSQTSNITQLQYDNRSSSQSPGTEVLFTNTTTKGSGDDFVGQDLRLQHTTDSFETTFTGAHARRDGQSDGSIGLSASTTFAIDGHKKTFVGSRLGQATAIVELNGTAVGEVMVIKNGTQTLARGRVGDRITLSLQPFDTYNLTLEPEKSDALVSYDNTPQTFKLVNNGVEIVRFDVARILLVFGRLINTQGEPLAWQRIKGASSSVLTDQFGNFQAEFGADEVMYVQNRETTCTAAVPALDLEDEIFRYVGDILCL